MPAFGNPLGLLALLGIPAVLAIHFLQRKAKELPVSTLFLLEHTRREAVGGRRIERLVPSIPLWMQLLAVLILAWFLSEPRYPREGSVQRIAVVVDSSASMAVFKQAAADKVLQAVPLLKGSASEVSLTVLESVPERPRLHAGTSTEGLAEALEAWQPRDGPVDPTQALRLARSLVSPEGSVVYVTDTPSATPLPFDALEIAVGEAIDNVGFTGVSFTREEGALIWKAMVRNHGKSMAERTWSVISREGASEARVLRMEPGSITTLQAAFPEGATQLRVVLSADRFTLDDVLPLVAPQPKPLVVFNASPASIQDLSGRLIRALESAQPGNDAASADLSITAYNPLDPSPPSGNCVVFVEDETRTGAWLKGGIIAEAHPLMDGLNWQSLLVRETIPLEQKPGDLVLLRQEQRPLILLREAGQAKQLLFNFDPALSNLEKQPAFIVLLHRFAERIRSAKIAPVSANLETGQALTIAAAPGLPLSLRATDIEGRELPAPKGGVRRAISSPGFMSVNQGDTRLLDAAVHFGDPREADFRLCAASDMTPGGGAGAIERHTKKDPLWRAWILALIACLLVSWRFIRGGRKEPQPVTT